MVIFNEVIKTLTPLLRQKGLTKKGNNYYLELDKNYGIVNFQKGRDSTKDVTFFTINFGVYSDVLGRLQNGNNDLVKRDIGQCQWEARVGMFMPESPDHWWKIVDSDNVRDIVSNLIEILQTIVIPEITKRLSDEDLINSWINENYAGTTEIGRFKYLTTLLNKKKDFNTLNQIVEAFMLQSQGKPNASIAHEHLKEIGYNK